MNFNDDSPNPFNPFGGNPFGSPEGNPFAEMFVSIAKQQLFRSTNAHAEGIEIFLEQVRENDPKIKKDPEGFCHMAELVFRPHSPTEWMVLDPTGVRHVKSNIWMVGAISMTMITIMKAEQVMDQLKRRKDDDDKRRQAGLN